MSGESSSKSGIWDFSLGKLLRSSNFVQNSRKVNEDCGRADLVRNAQTFLLYATPQNIYNYGKQYFEG